MPEAAQDPRIDELLAGLNPPQRDAVVHGEGPLLILAGAGSGKTRVLTHRIAYLMRTKQARADEILAITFTNKAAQEMRERVELLVGRATRAMWVMTFHSACARMLRADAHRLGYTRQFTIYDAADQRRLIKRCLDDLDIDAKRFTPRAMQAQISDAKNKLRSSEDYRQLVGSYFEQTVADVYEQYERELHRMNAMDFDDLLVRSVNLLELFQEVRDRYSQAFRWILVDEYQDTNHAQYRWLQLLASEHRNLAVVGDDDQSIYGFRGADIKNILSFQDDFVDAHVVKLEQNYRSTQTILSAANAVVAQQPRADDEGAVDRDRRGRSDQGPGAVRRARRGSLRRRRDRADGRRGRQPRGDRRLLPDQRAVAGARGHARAGADRLPGHRRHEVLRAGGDPGRRRVPDVPRQPAGRGGVHARRELAEARARADLAQSRVLSHADTMGVPVWDAAAEHRDQVPGLGTAAQKALGRFMSTMVRLRERMEGETPVGDLLDELLRETGYYDALEAERTIEAQGRLENLEELVRVGREYDALAEQGSVGEFLQQIALIADVDSLRDDEGLVTLMTLHNAKGLEFPIVFMIGMEDGVFPHSRAIDEGEIEEERRLAYVGLTRAMRDLTLTFARRRNSFGANSFGMRSRFIDEIPRELTDLEDKAAVGAGWSPGRVASWSNAAAATAEAHPDTAGNVFRLGDDVVHAAFGEGVVTGTEPGGIVVVRFAGDGSERKLMADYAPIKKR